MSDINEEQKRLYKRAEENDIKLLQDRINKAIEYMNDPDNFLCINVEEQGRVLMDEDSQNDLLNILKGKE
jgi:lysyl-tRNA synthetase class I